MGRRKSKKTLDQQVGQLVIFRSSYSMDEQVAQQESSEHGGDQGPGTQLDARLLHFHQPRDRRLSLLIRGQRQREGDLAAIGQQQHVLLLLDKQAAPHRVLGRPDPKGRLQPSLVHRQVRHRMRRTANAMRPPVVGQRGVVDLDQSGQLGKQVAGKPTKSGQPTHVALRDLQRHQAPVGLQLMSRLGQAQTQPIGLLASGHHMGPEIRQQRFRDQRLEELNSAVAKRVKRFGVPNRQLLIRDRQPLILPQGLIQRQRADEGPGNRSAGDPDRAALADVRINDQVDRHAAVPRGKAGRGEILAPHPRMKQLRLVPGQNQGHRRIRRRMDQRRVGVRRRVVRCRF